ncbi:DivIVA domain-containing protein [Nocardioides sp. Kera G14]|uniref:DivIVA domain-containing protein n=1 Tax=Nocardioides sp. Kera G14 TaxID=2884264 RepID=UPI001D12222A|nr:DivIVA domain-containing protein [Nocardioides sp. Kera G14]UDY22833.1 DivIVA domain-containing protein [Nocardioides sp. Kera G14]
MMWVFAIVVVLIMGGVAVVAAGRGEGLSPTYDDRRDVLVPTDRRLEARDLRRIRFTVGLVGYRASEVDALIARLADELDARQRPDAAAPSPAPADEATGSTAD